jgi:hypothetical protein
MWRFCLKVSSTETLPFAFSTLEGCCTFSKVRDDSVCDSYALTPMWTGTFAETTSPEHQLHWIIENGKAVRAADGLSNVVEAMKIANWRHDFLRYIDS